MTTVWFKLSNCYWNISNTIYNHIKWHKTLKKIRAFNGDEALFEVMQTVLRNFLECTDNPEKQESAKEVIELIERLKVPDMIKAKALSEINSRYPMYVHRADGKYTRQGDGWAGIHNGEEGYYRCVNGYMRFCLSPDQAETDRLIKELIQHTTETREASRRSDKETNEAFERLFKLIRENVYTWWAP